MLDAIADNPNSEALTWLLELEIVTNPNVLNALILNVFKMVKGLKDAEFVIDTKQKKLLIYLELNWFYKRFRQKEVSDEVLAMLDQVLPAFKKRVVYDKTLVEKALKIMGKK